MGANESSNAESTVIICKENGNGWCPINGVPQFDSTVPKNNVVLTNMLSCGVAGCGEQEVERKFSEANEKLKEVYVHPCYWIGPIILFVLFSLLFVLVCAFYVEPNPKGPMDFTGAIAFTFFILALVMLIPLHIGSTKVNKHIKRILQDHFADWNEIGIQVQHYPRYDGGGGYLEIILP